MVEVVRDNFHFWLIGDKRPQILRPLLQWQIHSGRPIATLLLPIGTDYFAPEILTLPKCVIFDRVHAAHRMVSPGIINRESTLWESFYLQLCF